MKGKSIYAFLYLAFHYNRHFLRKLFWRRSPGLARFIENYRDDRILPMTSADKNLLAASSRCLSCGLCDAFCPATRSLSQISFLGPSMLSHLMRSVPDFAGNLSAGPDGDWEKACAACRGCEEICPVGIPIRRLIDYVKVKDAEAAR